MFHYPHFYNWKKKFRLQQWSLYNKFDYILFSYFHLLFPFFPFFKYCISYEKNSFFSVFLTFQLSVLSFVWKMGSWMRTWTTQISFELNSIASSTMQNAITSDTDSKVQYPSLNRITLGQHKSDSINRRVLCTVKV